MNDLDINSFIDNRIGTNSPLFNPFFTGILTSGMIQEMYWKKEYGLDLKIKMLCVSGNMVPKVKFKYSTHSRVIQY